MLTLDPMTLTLTLSLTLTSYQAPAAFCRKAITSEKEFEMWGNGKQTRSFCYIDDAVSSSSSR